MLLGTVEKYRIFERPATGNQQPVTKFSKVQQLVKL